MSTRPALPGLMYHGVTADPSDSGFQRPAAHPYICTPAAFEQHLELIARSGRTPALVGELDLAAPGSRVLLTFDDGGLGAVGVGDALAHRGWRGHFFIVTSRIGSRGFLAADAVRYLRSCGHLIGSHSHTHPDIFPELSAARMRAEWSTSRTILEQLLGEPCTVASLPGGDLSDAVVESIDAAGYTTLFTSEPWLEPRRVGRTVLLGRFAVKASLAPETLARLLALRGWDRALLRRRLSVLARRGLAPVYRYLVRRRTAADLGGSRT